MHNVFFSFQIGFVVLKLSTWFPSFSVDSWTLITVFCMSPRSLVKTQRLPNKLSCLFISIFLFIHQKIILGYKKIMLSFSSSNTRYLLEKYFQKMVLRFTTVLNCYLYYSNIIDSYLPTQNQIFSGKIITKL